VGPDEQPARKQQPKSVTQAAKEGTPRELAVAVRDRIARAIEDEKTSPRDLAALTRRLNEVVREIEQIDARAAEEAKGAEGEVADAPFDASAI
jgi:ribosome-binding protein aMBF1 (putative translation factor)